MPKTRNPSRRRKAATVPTKLRRALDLLTADPKHFHSSRQGKAMRDFLMNARPWVCAAGVQGYGLARRTVGGKETDDLVVKVYVDRKLPESKLANPIPKRLRIPGIAGEVEIDVEEVGYIGREQHTGRAARPLRPGDGIGLADSTYGTGTLGCLVRKRNDPQRVYVLSNAHVLAMDGLAPPGTEILQPSGEYEGASPADVFAVLSESVPFDFSEEGFFSVVDAAIAEVTNQELVSAEFHDVGMPNGVSTTLARDMGVHIVGAASGLSEGVVRDLNFRFADRYWKAPGVLGRVGFRDQVLCSSYSRKGDSGAVVLNEDNEVVGLHFAGSTDSSNPRSVFTPIDNVLAALDIEIVTTTTLATSGPQPVSIISGVPDSIRAALPGLTESHRHNSSVPWRLTRDGLVVDGIVETTSGQPQTVRRVWNDYGASISKWASHFEVPVELIIATICTETTGNPDAIRKEPGYTSDDATPNRISVGLMQTLISTARSTLGNSTIGRIWLLNPDHSIQAGTSYINDQREKTRLDPPKVACAYNAGGIYDNDNVNNRWRMRQFPIGTGEHADRFMKWFNDCFRVFAGGVAAPPESFYAALRGG